MLVVTALGGNALLKRGDPLTAENQRANVRHAAGALARIVRAGHRLVVTHGNGPQVGLLALQGAAYKPDDLAEILRISDHVIFNSPGQIARLQPVIDAARKDGVNFDIGLRLNPLHAEGEVPVNETQLPNPEA